MNIRKYNNKLIIKPAKSRVKDFLDDIREMIKHNATVKTENSIRLLNPKIRGWANYYAHVCAKETFGEVDHHIFMALWRWSKKRHPNKSMKWIKAKYFRRERFRDWIFFAKTKSKQDTLTHLDIVIANRTPIKRHIKIRANATPYDPNFRDYLDKRIASRENKKKILSAKPKR